MPGDRAAVRHYVKQAQGLRESEFRSAPRKNRTGGEHPDNVREEALGDLILEGIHAALELAGVADKGPAREVPTVILQAIRKVAATRRAGDGS